MSFFDSFGKPINDNDDDKDSPATESTNIEIRHDGFGNYNYSIYSAEPNTSNIDDAVSNDILNSLNASNSQGGKSGENN